MNLEEVKNEYKKTQQEFDEVQKNYSVLKHKLQLLSDVITSFSIYEDGANFGFDENVNSLTRFLKSGLVKFGKDEKGVELYCREKVFVAAFRDYCREHNFFSTKWTSQFYNGPLADFNIKIVKSGNKRYPNKPGEQSFGGIFFMGVDINDKKEDV